MLTFNGYRIIIHHGDRPVLVWRKGWWRWALALFGCRFHWKWEHVVWPADGETIIMDGSETILVNPQTHEMILQNLAKWRRGDDS
jgi:hypothetical protein